MKAHRLACLALLMLPAAQSAGARGPSLPEPPRPTRIWDSWPLLAEDRDGECRLEILGNGKFMLIRAQGLGAAETGRFRISNETMKPVDWRIITDTKGVFARAYLPNLWTRADGTVRDWQTSGVMAVSIETRRCRVQASAPWKTGVRVID